jgi:hypothetical protein
VVNTHRDSGFVLALGSEGGVSLVLCHAWFTNARERMPTRLQLVNKKSINYRTLN